MRINGLLLVASLAGMMAACGQKGPLVLPDQQRPHKKIILPQPRTPPGSQAPASQSPQSPATASPVPAPSAGTPTPPAPQP